MSRPGPGDASGFTSSSPGVPPDSTAATPSSIHLSQAAPTNETPQQKIARLRAAAARAKLGKESQGDKIVRVGRVWADRAHRVTAWGLIGLTVVFGVFATFAIGDMLVHNRRKRRQWLQEQQRQSAIALQAAHEAAAKGVATEDQILMLNVERAAQEAEVERTARKGIFARARDSMFGESSKEEEKGGRILAEVRAAQAQAQQAQPASTISATAEGFLEDVNTGIEQVKSKVKTAAQATEKVFGSASTVALGGPLDRQAQVSADALSRQTRSWVSWVTGR